MSLSMWRKASPRRKRIFSIVAVFMVAIIITVIGSLTPMSSQEAKQISNDVNQTSKAASERGILTQYIFGNNLLIALLMFIPVVGPLLGFYVLYNTGTVIGAIATAQGVPSILTFIVLVITPVFWLEFAAYSTAMAESVWLLRRIIQGRGIRELKNACIFVSICTILLLIGAVVETVLISVGA